MAGDRFGCNNIPRRVARMIRDHLGTIKYYHIDNGKQANGAGFWQTLRMHPR